MAGPQKKATRATLWVEGGWIMVRTPYNPEFIDELKNEIPREARKWDTEEKIWKVDASYADDLEKLVRKFYGEPTVVQQEVLVTASAPEDDPYGMLLREAPNDVIKKVYLMIATKVHPDAGGSTESMTRVNQAWDAIKRERGL